MDDVELTSSLCGCEGSNSAGVARTSWTNGSNGSKFQVQIEWQELQANGTWAAMGPAWKSTKTSTEPRHEHGSRQNLVYD
eukprot:37406-Eustigmatos_ZCMA.PRE.1